MCVRRCCKETGQVDCDGDRKYDCDDGVDSIKVIVMAENLMMAMVV